MTKVSLHTFGADTTILGLTAQDTSATMDLCSCMFSIHSWLKPRIWTPQIRRAAWTIIIIMTITTIIIMNPT